LITGGEINFKITLAELVSNGEHDSELLYTLQEFNMDEILDLKIKENIVCKSTRDCNEYNNIIVNRIK